MKINLSDYTWEEAQDLSGLDPVVLLPLGAFEQHGKHLPLKVDEFMVNNIAKEAVRKYKQKKTNAVVTPVIWSPGLIGKNFDWLEFNIANKLVKIFRDPILGNNIDLSLYLEVLLYDVGLLIVLILVVRKVNIATLDSYRRDIIGKSTTKTVVPSSMIRWRFSRSSV